MTRKKSYQYGSVQLKNRIWTLRYRELDHRTGRYVNKRERLGEFKNKTAARRAAEPIMARVNEHNNSDKPPEVQHLTFRQFIETRWKAYTEKKGHEPSTLYCYNNLLKNHILPRFGEMLMQDIKPVHVGEFLESIKGAKVQVIYSILRVMFALAVDYEVIPQSPVKPKRHRPMSEKVEKPTLTVEEIRAVLNHLDEKLRLFSLLIAVTGMRVGEAQALRWMNFDESSRELSVTHTLYASKLKPPKTKTSIRTLRLHASVAEMLAVYRAQSEFPADSDFIFCRADGTPLWPEASRIALHRAMDKAGIAWAPRTHGFHIFRHTAGSLMYARSRDLKLVQNALGHSGITTTSDIYVHLNSDRVAEGTEGLAEVILGGFSLNCTPDAPNVSKMVS